MYSQHPRRSWLRHAALLVLALTLPLLAACQSDLPGDVAAAPTATAAPTTFQGTIVCVGSPVLIPLVTAVGNRLRQLDPDAFVLVLTSTTQLGLATLQDDGADIAMADIGADALLGAEAVGLTEYRVAAVPYAIVTNPTAGVSNLSRAQIRQIYAGDVTNWRQVGGLDSPIQPFQPSKGAGLRYLFNKTFLPANAQGDIESPAATSTSRPLDSVAANYGGIGYVPVGTTTPAVHVLSVDGVPPSVESVAAGSYPFWSYARLYTKGPAGGLARAFIDFALSPNVQTDTIAPLGFTPLASMKGAGEP